MWDRSLLRRALVAAVLVVASGSLAGPAAAVGEWPAVPTLRDLAAGSIRGPKGWEVWCATSPERCARDGTALVALDAATATLLERLFHRVHARITAEVERPGFDDWRVIDAPGFGDCEDYALSWREALVAAGLPREALDIAVAETEQGEIHAVLAIHTDLGTLIFDNRQSGPKPWTALPYAWLAIEPATASITPWHALPDHQRIGMTPPLTAEGAARR